MRLDTYVRVEAHGPEGAFVAWTVPPDPAPDWQDGWRAVASLITDKGEAHRWTWTARPLPADWDPWEHIVTDEVRADG